MTRADTFDAVVAGLTAAGIPVEASRLPSLRRPDVDPSRRRLEVQAVIGERDDGRLVAKRFTRDCSGRNLYDAIREAEGIKPPPMGTAMDGSRGG